jgi:heme a synthase
MARATDNRWLSRFAVLTSVATLLLISIGGLVTSHEAGMAVPDWPNSYGYNMFFFPPAKWIGAVLYEHSHRLVASLVGLLTLILALWLHGRKSRPFLKWGGIVLSVLGIVICFLIRAKWQDGVFLAGTGIAAWVVSFVWPTCDPAERRMRVLGWTALGAVILQGVLGGLRVTLYKDEIGIFHATLAQVFFVFMSAIALFTTRWWKQLPNTSTTAAGSLRMSYLAITTMVLCQLVLGATMRHQHAGLAIPDFPTAYGKWWPATDPESIIAYNQRRVEVTHNKSVTAGQVNLQMAHRVLAVLISAAVFVAMIATIRRLRWSNPLSTLVAVWGGLIALQFLLGAATVLTNKSADIATAHVVIGALSLLNGVVLSVVSFRLWNRQTAAQSSATFTVPAAELKTCS